MKRIWIATAILAAILGSTLWHGSYINTFAEDLILLLESAEEKAEKGDWSEAASLTQTVLEKWEEHSLYLHVTLRHSDSDEVFTGLREILEFLERQENGEYSAANARIIARLQLIAEAERLTLENVF